MAEWNDEYQRYLAEARLIYQTELTADMVEALYVSMADAIERIVADFSTGKITAERAIALERSIIFRLAELGGRLTGDLDAAIAEAAQLATDGHGFGLEAASRAAGVSVSTSFAEVPQRALEMMVQRRGFAGTFRTLINRHLEDMADDVEAVLRQAVIRGLSGQRAGQELAMLMARDDPALLETLQNLGPRGGRTVRAIREGIEIPEMKLRRARSLLQDSYRIAVTELNVSFFAADAEASVTSDVVSLVKWEVSSRHWGLSTSPDACSAYHLRDWTGFGPGLFHPQSVPLQPHPFCACHTSKVLRPPSEWDKPKPDLPTPVYARQSDFREVMNQAAQRHRGGSRTITDKYLQNQMELANGLVRLSDEVARGVEV